MSDLYASLRAAIRDVENWLAENSYDDSVPPPYDRIAYVMGYAKGMIPADTNGYNAAAEMGEWDEFFKERRDVAQAMKRYEFSQRGSYDWYVRVYDHAFVNWVDHAEGFPTQRAARRWALRDAGYGHLIH